MTTYTREPTTRAWIYDVRMAQFVLKIEKLSHIMGPRASQDLRSPSPIMAPGLCKHACKEVCDVKQGIDPYPLLGRVTDDGQIL